MKRVVVDIVEEKVASTYITKSLWPKRNRSVLKA